MLAAVVQHMHLRAVEPHPGRLVAEERIVLPTVPEPNDDIMEFSSALIAQRVVQMRIETVVHRLVLGLRGDEVPTGPAAADVVDGQEAASKVVGLIVAGGAG